MADIMLELENVSKCYGDGEHQVHALSGCNLNIRRGEIVAIVGASGCGKSTLLHIAGLLLNPSSGRVVINGTDCSTISDKARTLLRREQLGFVYQFHHLLAELNVTENVNVPLTLQKRRDDAQVASLLDHMGLQDKAYAMPSTLSGGQQQRVAIARALVHQPSLLLADEPTGNLDPETALSVETLMIKRLREQQASALIVTHNHALAQRMDRVITL